MSEVSTYDQLLSAYNFLKEKTNTSRQEVYQAKKELAVQNATYSDCIEMAKQELAETETKILENKAQIQKEIAEHKTRLRAKVQEYKDKLKSIEKQLEMKQNRKKSCMRKIKNNIGKETEIEIKNKREEISKLKEYYNEMMNKKNELQKSRSNLEYSLEELQVENKDLRETLDVLNRKSQLLQGERDTLLEEVASIKVELEGLNKPLDVASRGNSMFAEVNDRKVLLEKKINKVQDQFFALRLQAKEHNIKYARLKKKNDQLLQLFQNHQIEIPDELEEEKQMLRKQTEELEITFNNIASELESILNAKIDSDTTDYFEYYFCLKSKEMCKVLEDFNKELKERFLLEYACNNIKREIREVETSIAKWDIDIDVLTKNKIVGNFNE